MLRPSKKCGWPAAPAVQRHAIVVDYFHEILVSGFLPEWEVEFEC